MEFSLCTHTLYERRSDFLSNYTSFKTWVLIATETGRFRFETDSCNGEAGVGDLVLGSPQGKFHRFALEPIAYHVFQFALEGPTSFPLRDGVFGVYDTARLYDDFACLRRFTNRFDERAQSRIQSLLGDLLHLMWDCQLERPSLSDPLMDRAAELLKSKAGKPFSMRIISNEMGLSPVAFTRRFRASHGCNPVEYLRRERLNIARMLLLGTSLSLDEIAARCGYASGFYLSDVWKRSTGVAPGAFRRRYRV